MNKIAVIACVTTGLITWAPAAQADPGGEVTPNDPDLIQVADDPCWVHAQLPAGERIDVRHFACQPPNPGGNL